MTRTFLTLSSCTLLLLSGCSFFGSSTHPALEVVPMVDLNKYLGKWYEIASLPVFAQKGCHCTSAEYSLREDGTIKVINRCRKDSSRGEVDQIEGKAFIVEGSNNAKLKVQFFWPFRGDYWIIDLDEQYSYAVVGVPSRKYYWILSRTPVMNPDTLSMLIGRLKVKGFDTAGMQYTDHSCPD